MILFVCYQTFFFFIFSTAFRSSTIWMMFFFSLKTTQAVFFLKKFSETNCTARLHSTYFYDDRSPKDVELFTRFPPESLDAAAKSLLHRTVHAPPPEYLVRVGARWRLSR